MKTHKIKVKVPVEKRGLFGIKKAVYEERVIEVDDKKFRELKKKQKHSVDVHTACLASTSCAQDTIIERTYRIYED